MAPVLITRRLVLTLCDSFPSFEPNACHGSFGSWVLGLWVVESLGDVRPLVIAFLACFFTVFTMSQGICTLTAAVRTALTLH